MTRLSARFSRDTAASFRCSAERTLVVSTLCFEVLFTQDAEADLRVFVARKSFDVTWEVCSTLPFAAMCSILVSSVVCSASCVNGPLYLTAENRATSWESCACLPPPPCQTVSSSCQTTVLVLWFEDCTELASPLRARILS